MASAAMLLSLLGCSVVPDWSEPDWVELDVSIHYDASSTARSVSIPSSSPHLLIRVLRSEPEDLQESFADNQRHLVLPGNGPVELRCYYRLIRRHAADGTPLPWPRPRELFPDADRIVVHGGLATGAWIQE